MADSGQGYKRPQEAFRLKWGGVKTNSAPDAVGPNKYPYAQNIRAVQDSSVRCRPGLPQLLSANTSAYATNIRAYSALATDNLPQLIARYSNDSIWMGSSAGGAAANVGSLAGAGASAGASPIPFRPAQSPNPWMYVANGSDYQKFSAPSATNVVTQQKVGIAEPQSQPEAVITANQVAIIASAFFTAGSGGTHSGVASAPVVQTRISDTIQSVFADPSGIAINGSPITIGTTSSVVNNYTRQMAIINSTLGEEVLVQDVFPALPTAIDIAAIYYFTGGTGHCVVVPASMPTGPGDGGESLYTQNLVNSLRRGALVKFSSGPETCIVWNVVEGPNGTVCFETSTVNTHTSAESFTCPPAIQITAGSSPELWAVGQSLTSPTAGFNLSGAGIGTITTTASLAGLFVNAGGSYQPEDYIHISFAITTLASLNELKFLLDVGDGSFTQNFYFYTVRVSDIEAAVQNTLTQLGAAQLVTQRATIDEEQAAASHNQLATASSAQTTPGDGQWVEIVFPISALTRVGNDQTKSLQNLNAVQFLFNVSAATNASVGECSVFGRFQPDVGDSGAPYLYRVRPRSSVTGAKGNPSPETRYGVNPRRNPVSVVPPSAAYDAQIDTWDVFRYGGSLTSWRKVGQQASSSVSPFVDNYSDEAVSEGEELEFDNLEPWPSIDVPFLQTTDQVVGTALLVQAVTPGNLLRYLPGNLIQIGGINVYTLRTRPTLISGNTYLLSLVENAGALLAGIPVTIYEPEMARQLLPYMWGPDAAGTVFAVGDPVRPGVLYPSKNYAPDAAPDSYPIEITPPTEPLLGGETIDGLSYVASPKRWWALYPQLSNPTQRYSVVQQPLTRGLAAPWGHCNDGKTLYWWAEDGIYSSGGGSLTDADLYNLFPHDGVAGVDYTYNGQTIYAPNYAYAASFRLVVCEGYLRALYRNSTGAFCTLTYDIRRHAWTPDTFATMTVTTYYALEQQAGTLLSETRAYPQLVAGSSLGPILVAQDFTNDITGLGASTTTTAAITVTGLQNVKVISFVGFEIGDTVEIDAGVNSESVVIQGINDGGPLSPGIVANFTKTHVAGVAIVLTPPIGTISAVIATLEWDGGDLRAGEQWGDLWAYLQPVTATGVMATPMAFGAQVAPPTTIPTSAGVVQTPVSLGGEILSDFLGLQLAWTDNFATQSAPTVIQAWEPSYVPKPETIADRYTDWYDAGTEAAKWVQGFLLHADTFDAVKGLQVRDGDALALHAFTPVVQHNGECVIAYSFNAPFVAHTMRLEPTDQVAWRFFGVEWVYEATPEMAETWQTQGTAHGLQGYMHLKQVSPCYAATQPVTLTITSYDGQSPAAITLPATGGAMQKLAVILTANKGQLFFYVATSTAPFQLYLENWEVEVGAWARQDNYLRYRNLGSSAGDQARI
jgi:hypothetical protein